MAISQSANVEMGSRFAGLGYTSVALYDPWGLRNNIAGISQASDFTISASQEVMPRLEGANRISFLAIAPINNGAFGLSFFKFGDNLYSENLLTGGFSHKLGIASIGIRGNYLQLRTEGFATHSALTIDFGGIAELTPKFFIGASINNLSQSKITTEAEEVLPTKMTVGFGYKPIEQTYLSAEIAKDLINKATVKAGVEYLIHQKIAVRTGYNLYPSLASFGLGFKTNKFQIDYAFQYSPILSSIHQATISYQFKKL